MPPVEYITNQYSSKTFIVKTSKNFVTQIQVYHSLAKSPAKLTSSLRWPPKPGDKSCPDNANRHSHRTMECYVKWGDVNLPEIITKYTKIEWK